MPWSGTSGSETYERSDGTRTGVDVYAQQKAAGIDVVATQHDSTEQDMATALDECLKKDGGNTAIADIPMGDFGLTGVRIPVADAEPVTREYAEDNLVLVTSELTIATGVVTPTASRHTIDTESDDAADDLDQIVTSGMRTGQLLYLYAEDSSRIVTVRNAQGAAGQIHTHGNSNIDLSTEQPLILLFLDGADCYEVSRPAQRVLLGDLTASNDASLDFVTLLTTSHDRVRLEFENLVPATDVANLYLRMADSASTWSTTGYNWSRDASISTGGGAQSNGSSVAQFEICDIGVGSDGSETGVSGFVEIYRPMVASYTHILFFTEAMGSDAAFFSIHGGGVLQESLTHESMQLLYSSGNVESGDARLWGYTK